MVRLFRGDRGRGMPRLPPMMQRPMRPHGFKPDFITPFGVPRPRLMRGHPVRPGLRPPLPRHGMIPPPLHPRPPPIGIPHPPPLHPSERPLPMQILRRPPPMNFPGRIPGMPPPHPHGPPLGRPLGSGPPFLRGRGGPLHRGVAVKRLGPVANGKAKKVQKRKEKTEGAFYCEMCDRGWKTHEQLDAHLLEHEVCGRDGCTFTAHPKVVLKHVQIQHDSGLYQRIVFTENPADVAKWIAERKTRYPTKENVEKKAAQSSEMMKRGERMPRQGNRFNRKERFHNSGDQRQPEVDKTCINPNKGPRQRKPVPRKFAKKDEGGKWRDPDAWRGDLPQFPGTAAILSLEDPKTEVNNDEMDFNDDEWSDKKTTKKEVTKPAALVSNVLASLISNYGSDMSDDEGNDNSSQNVEKPVFSPKKEPETLLNTKPEDSSSVSIDHTTEANPIQGDPDSGPEECPVDHEDKFNIPIPNPVKPFKEDSTQPVMTKPHAPVRRPPMKRHQLSSLLDKLLKNEIRQERNAILQCVRYVVDNNFLGCGNTT